MASDDIEMGATRGSSSASAAPSKQQSAADPPVVLPAANPPQSILHPLASDTMSFEPTPPTLAVSIALISTVCCATIVNTFNSGVLTVTIPTIAADIGLPPHLIMYPASVYALAMCCTQILLGSLADLIGNSTIFLAGVALYAAMTLAVGLAQTGIQLIIFRAISGLAMAAMMPAAVSIITTSFPKGKWRNWAIAIYGGGNPLGFALGLCLGGVFVKTSSWRTAYYLSAGISAASFILAVFTLPQPTSWSLPSLRHRLSHGFDWAGVAISSTCLGLLSYLLAEIAHGSSNGGNTGAVETLRQAKVIVPFVLAFLLAPAFVFWESYCERVGRPVILPNSVWRRYEFTGVCLAVFLVWSFFNAMGYFASLFFQDIQGLDALQASLRFLPLPVVGLAVNIAAGALMDKVPAWILAVVGGTLSAVAPLLFALQDPAWIYWAAGFPAMCLSVISSDLLFNISQLVITANFSGDRQALAGAVFGTVTQLGNSLGVALSAIVSASVAASVAESGVDTEHATLVGYRAAFWFCFGMAVASGLVSCVALMKVGKVGAAKKEE